MFERPRIGYRAVLVHLGLPFIDHESLRELKGLALSAGCEIAEVVTAKRSEPTPKLFIGQGKAEEIHKIVDDHDAGLVIFDHELSPAQERNLERIFQCRVLDRSGLILDIFSQRARTYEGKLQVELAQLEYISTRLVRGWSHLERQQGGIGLRGPGETQLEMDRRLIGHRIKMIKDRLAKVRQQRHQGRQGRLQAQIMTVCFVGYTNAGKSTLFNAVTQADAGVANQLFATLDPTARRIELPYSLPVVAIDTVGFIKNLPHHLVAAFKATLEEATLADLLIHVVDAHHERREEQRQSVHEVLQTIGADHVPCLEVFNKVDLLEHELEHTDYNDRNRPERVWLSARLQSGLEGLKEAMAQCLVTRFVHCCVCLEPHEGKLLAQLHDHEAILQKHYTDTGMIQLEIKLPQLTYQQLFERDNRH